MRKVSSVVLFCARKGYSVRKVPLVVLFCAPKGCSVRKVVVSKIVIWFWGTVRLKVVREVLAFLIFGGLKH